jgi:hypothetical protein
VRDIVVADKRHLEMRRERGEPSYLAHRRWRETGTNEERYVIRRANDVVGQSWLTTNIGRQLVNDRPNRTKRDLPIDLRQTRTSDEASFAERTRECA